MRRIKLSLLTLISISCCLGIVRAQQPTATATPSPAASPTPEVSPAKRALIKEILDLTNSREGSEAMFNAQFDEMKKEMPNITWQSISSMDEFKKLTPAQKEEVRTKLNERSDRVAQHMKELFLARVDTKQMVEEISYAVYDKHFTETELKDLLAFYRSDIGRKVVKESPALFADSIAKGSELLAPKIRDIIEDTQRSETAELAQEIEKLLKTTPKTPVRRPASRRRP